MKAERAGTESLTTTALLLTIALSISKHLLTDRRLNRWPDGQWIDGQMEWWTDIHDGQMGLTQCLPCVPFFFLTLRS